VLIIEGSLTFREEDRDQVLAGLTDITRLSRVDAGCVAYWWAEDLEVRNTFHFFECWESKESFDAHITSPHELAFGERYLPLITGATASQYTATPAPPASPAPPAGE
jgi:quinol monooxygenase YgiN